MTKIKFCGLSRACDIEWVNEIRPEYVGFVFAPKSRRHVSFEKALELKRLLDPTIKAVGVFVDESPEKIAALFNKGIIDMVQLHGSEDEEYIMRLRTFTGSSIIKAFPIKTLQDITAAKNSSADFILLDSGGGTGTVFDWKLIRDLTRPYFLAGGLTPQNARSAIDLFNPYALDVSSSLETGGFKDKEKMTAFMKAVRQERKG